MSRLQEIAALFRPPQNSDEYRVLQEHRQNVESSLKQTIDSILADESINSNIRDHVKQLHEEFNDRLAKLLRVDK